MSCVLPTCIYLVRWQVSDPLGALSSLFLDMCVLSSQSSAAESVAARRQPATAA